jgi:hypothetical protein
LLAALLTAALLSALAVRILLILLAGLRLTALLLTTLILAALLTALILVRVTHWEILLDRGLIPQSRQSINVVFVPVPTHIRWFPVPWFRRRGTDVFNLMADKDQ